MEDFNKSICKVVKYDGQLYLTDVSGNKLPKQSSLSIRQDCMDDDNYVGEGVAFVTVGMWVSLDLLNSEV
jgi:hypothetical protein